MKKVLAFLMAVMMMLSLASCGTPAPADVIEGKWATTVDIGPLLVENIGVEEASCEIELIYEFKDGTANMTVGEGAVDAMVGAMMKAYEALGQDVSAAEAMLKQSAEETVGGIGNTAEYEIEDDLLKFDGEKYGTIKVESEDKIEIELEEEVMGVSVLKLERK